MSNDNIPLVNSLIFKNLDGWVCLPEPSVDFWVCSRLNIQYFYTSGAIVTFFYLFSVASKW